MAERTGLYRIEQVVGGYEAQMLYPTGLGVGDAWQPLNSAGYWCDPEAYSTGIVADELRTVFATQAEAAAAIRRAKEINGDA